MAFNPETASTRPGVDQPAEPSQPETAVRPSFNPATASQTPGRRMPGGTGYFGLRPPETPEQRQQRETFAISEALSGDGITFIPSEIDVETGLDFLSRADIALGDSFEEKRRKFKKHHPKGGLFKIVLPGDNGVRLVFKEDLDNPDEAIKTVEEASLSFADLADIAGDLPAALGSAVATRGTSAIGAAFKGAVGAATGESAKQLVEQARGEQLQPFMESAAQSARVGGEALFGGLLAAPAEKFFRGLAGEGIIRTTPESRALTVAEETLQAGGTRAAPLMAHQISPEHKVLNRFARQAFSTSTLGERQLKKQAKQLGLVAGAMRDEIIRDPFRVGERTRIMGRRLLREGEKIIRAGIGKQVTMRQGERALFKGADDWVAASRNHGKSLYENVDEAAGLENPVFNLSRAQRVASDIQRGIVGVSPDMRQAEQLGIVQQARPDAPVSESLGALQGVIGDLRKLDPTQDNYNVIKTLRTRLFDIIDNQPWQWDYGKRQAMDLWGALTNTMLNPENQAPNFVNALRQASTYWRERANLLQVPAIQQLINQNRQNTGLLAVRFSEPNGLIPEIRAIMLDPRLGARGARQWEQFRTAAKMRLLQDEGAVARYRQWQRKDPESLDMIVPKGERNNFLRLAEANDDFTRNRVARVVEETEQSSRVVSELLKDQDAAGIGNLLRFYGGPGSEGHKTLRAGVFHHFITESLQEDAKGVTSVSFNKVRQLWNEYNRNGILDRLLLPGDKAKLFTLKEYSRFFEIAGDPGVSLEAAQAITDLKHPSSFFRGVHKLGMNTMMARILQSPFANRLLVGKNRQFGKQWPVIAAAEIMSILNADAAEESIRSAFVSERKQDVSAP